MEFPLRLLGNKSNTDHGRRGKLRPWKSFFGEIKESLKFHSLGSVEKVLEVHYYCRRASLDISWRSGAGGERRVYSTVGFYSSWEPLKGWVDRSRYQVSW